MTPRLVACYFGGGDWDRLARVLEHSASRACVGWRIEIERVEAPRPDPRLGGHNVSNTHKLEHWTRRVDEADDGERVMLIDVDTMILAPLESAWASPFDVGYTVRDSSRAATPFNAGVVFLRVSDRVRAFMEHWRAENRRMLEDAAYFRPWYRLFGGINQGALGKLLTERMPERLGVVLGQLPCSVWNCEQATWPRFDPRQTRIVHVKDSLRLAALGTGAGRVQLMPMVRAWRGIEREALRLATEAGR